MKAINTYISTIKRISSIDDYILEKLHINKATKLEYIYHPKTKDELIECIKEKIEKEGLGTEGKPLSLNDIDTSEITDMSELFDINDGSLTELSKPGYFDISDWNVSKVEDMSYMFSGSDFDGDLSKWDVSKVKKMSAMFDHSYFDGDISRWDVSNVKNMNLMFIFSKFTGENGDISNWDVSSVEYMDNIFNNCPLEKNPPKWYHK